MSNNYIRIEEIRREEEKLQKEIKDIDDNIVNNLTELEDIRQWTEMKEAKQSLLDSLTSEREKIQNLIKNNFISNIRKKSVPTRNNKNNDIYKLAKEDVHNTVYEGLCFPAEDIANLFSTPEFQIQPLSGSQVQSPYPDYEWYDKLNGNYKSRIIPLSFGVEQPKEFCKKQQKIVDKHFLLNFVYTDKGLQKRVADYYRQYNINFTVRIEKNMVKNRMGKTVPRQTFFFTLTPIDGYIIFP